MLSLHRTLDQQGGTVSYNGIATLLMEGFYLYWGLSTFVSLWGLFGLFLVAFECRWAIFEPYFLLNFHNQCDAHSKSFNSSC